MSVDMYERRFRQELGKLPFFEHNDKRDPQVWRVGFPAWHALFSSLCLYGHSTGYRLPSFDDFFRYCHRAYTNAHQPKKGLYEPYFDGDLLPGMRQRVSVWYESGMTELYLYACLAEAIEDKAKCGVVLYDPRADWKLKADVIVIVRKKSMRVSAFVGEQSDRQSIEARRDVVERDRKKNTMESAHWQNSELAAMPVFEISRTDTDLQVANGIRLFSLASINRLLASIYQEAGVEGWLFSLGGSAQ